MKPQDRVEALQKKHALLSALIEQEEKTRSTDDMFIQKLKKQKLALKDVITLIRSAPETQIERATA